jgi:hypothetical protein
VPRSLSGGSACRYSNGNWQASVTVTGMQAGDSVAVRLCVDNNCPGNTGGNMTCSGGNCTYSGTGASSSNNGVRFVLTAAAPCTGDTLQVSMSVCALGPAAGPQGPREEFRSLADQGGGDSPTP